MLRKLRSLHAWALLLLLIGGALILGSDLWYRSGEWSLVLGPIDLTEGRNHSFDFESKSDKGYEIQIEFEFVFENQRSFNELACLAGARPIGEGCVDIERELNVSWELSNGGRQIASGSNAKAYGLSPSDKWRVGTVVGHFPSTAGEGYQLRVDVLSDAPRLSQMNPRLRLRRDALEHKYRFVYATVLTYLALAFLALGGVLGIAAGVKAGVRLWKRRRSA